MVKPKQSKISLTYLECKTNFELHWFGQATKHCTEPVRDFLRSYKTTANSQASGLQIERPKAFVQTFHEKSFIDSVVSNLAIVDKLNIDLSRHRVSDCHFYHSRPDTAKQSTQLEPSPSAIKLDPSVS